MPPCTAIALAILLAAAGSPAPGLAGSDVEVDATLEGALRQDNQCQDGDDQCALNALQAHGLKKMRSQSHTAASSGAARADAMDEGQSLKKMSQSRDTAAESVGTIADARVGAAGRGAAEEDHGRGDKRGEWGPGSCQTYGCYGFVRSRPCQCNAKCHQYNNCCADYQAVCMGGQTNANTKGDCYKTGKTYQLSWQAQGYGFFNDWTFVTEDMVHGAQQFTTREEALATGVIAAEANSARLSIGGLRSPSRPDEAYKRYAAHIRTNKAWDPKKAMIIAMKYHTVPHGCGVWPGFWTVNSDIVWPKGGELDILEYANFDANKVSFHVDNHCTLDVHKIGQCLPQRSQGAGVSDCYTSYFHGKYGCIPRQQQRRGDEYANSPGVIAAQWTEDKIMVYLFPEGHIPQDLENNRPEPDNWPSESVVAILPFSRPCDSIGPQEIVLNIQLCGDAAGGPWSRSSCGHYTQMEYSTGRCKSGLSAPFDCCTQFVTRPDQESVLKANAQFNVSYVKVFTPDGSPGVPSGTYKRGGTLLW